MPEILCQFGSDFPILGAFQRCRADASWIRGPLGSGKTVGTVQRLFWQLCEQEPNAKGVRPSRWLVVRNCYTPDTEILTERRGWVFFPDLREDDRVAMLDGDHIVWKQPTYYYSAHYDGDTITYHGEGASFSVTPDHHLYTSALYGRDARWMPFKHERADEAFRKVRRVKRDAKWSGKREEWMTPALFRWLGFWFAEGCSGVYPCSDGVTRYQCVVVQKPGRVDVEKLFKDAGLPFSRSSEGHWRLRTTPETKPLIEALSHTGKATTKKCPSWILDAPADCLREFLEGFIDGDGCRGRVTVACTSSRELAGDLQEIALKCGLCANVNDIDTTRNHWAKAPGYSVTIIKREAKKQPRLQPNLWKREPYSGPVYCVEVPSHIIYVRRKGRAMWCGQTYLDLTQTTIKDFLEVFEPEGHPGLFGKMRYGGLEPPNFRARFARPDGTIVDAEIIFLALDRPDSIRKLKGYQVSGIWFNELSEIAKSIVDMADLRHGRYPSRVSGGVSCSWHGWFGDTNSFDETHWLAKMEKDIPHGYECFVQPGGVLDTGEVDAQGRKVWAVNPQAENLDKLPKDYYERGMRGKEDSWIRVMLANQYGFVVHGLPVHPRFSEDLHVLDHIAPMKQYPIDVGLDFGHTPAAVIGQDWRHVGRYVALRCLTSENMSAELFAPELKLLLEKDFAGYPIRGWGDPAGDGDRNQATEDTPIRIVRAKGIPIRAAPTNKWALRVASLDRPLTRICVDTRPAYQVSRHGCPELIRALSGGYHYRELQVSSDQPRHSEQPEKNIHSHVAEAEHYRLLGSGEGLAALRPPDDSMYGNQSVEVISNW